MTMVVALMPGSADEPAKAVGSAKASAAPAAARRTGRRRITSAESSGDS
jgi:hypothetical protein